MQRFPEPVKVRLPDGKTVMLTGCTGVSVELDGCGTTVSDTVSYTYYGFNTENDKGYDERNTEL